MKNVIRRGIALVCLSLMLMSLLAFAETERLQLPAGLTEISESAFANTTGIEEVAIGQGVQRIESRAFAGSSVKLVIFPENCSLTYIAPDAFDGTEGLRFVSAGNPVVLAYMEDAGIAEYTAGPDLGQYHTEVVILPGVRF